MATKEEILEEVERLGRLSTEQEVVLYNISLRQDELGRQPTNMLLSDLEANELYKDMLEREYLTYEVYNHGGSGKAVIASLIVTLKGMRYCNLYADEIEPHRQWDVAGNARKR
ncbi:MAG: hypothetical protein SOV74_08950 [Coriobacteriales bacterium]|nr:hypothetical protein [Coriobacteriales bacterium]